MPTSTFFNLPPPKKERLLQAAVAEFSRKPFGDASINRIIQEAEISRGSFYQYFTDKSDIFNFIMSHFGEQLEKTILSSLDACNGDLLATPLAIFDQVQGYIRENHCRFQVLLDITRQNVSLDMCQLWNVMDTAQTVLERADLSRLNTQSIEEQLALLQMLFTAVTQALMAAFCGKSSPEESRKHLACQIEIIRQGAAK